MTFLQNLSALLATRARRVQPGDPDFASIDLAAHLFAAATYLRERYSDARMDTERPEVAVDLEEALALAVNISSGDTATAYLQMCGALLGIDASFTATGIVIEPALSMKTTLQPLHDDGRPALFGAVQHWIKPGNPWDAARNQREVIAPFVNRYPATPADHLGTLGVVWDRGQHPEVRPVRCRASLAPAKGFRVALCPLFCDAHPRFAVTPDGGQFTIDRARPHSDPAVLAEHLARLAPQLEALQVGLLVLPELSVPEAARADLAKMLVASRCLQGIVGGSFHVWRDDHAMPLNEAVFQIPHGVAWEHHKRGYFRVTDRDVRRLGRFFTQPLPSLQPRVVEGIRHGNALQFWDTRIGRIAVLICADAIAHDSMIPAVERCRPDVVLLPSLSMETEPFEQLGEGLARHGISVIYVNAASACPAGGHAVAGFVHVALPAPAPAPLSRVRWVAGVVPKACQFPGQDWIDAPTEQVQVLEDQAGIVVDLDQHLSWRPIPVS